MNEIEELIEKYNHIFSNSVPDMLDDPFSRGEDAGSGRVSHEIIEDLKQLQQSLQLEKEITEQQALNKLAERFPMTTDQIVSTLEMNVAHVEQEKIEVPELVVKYLDYARQCLDLNVLTVCNYQNVKSNMGTLAADEIVHWAHKNPNEFIKAYQTGDYTVKKEQLYYVPLCGLETSDGAKQYLTYDKDKNTYFASRKTAFLKQKYKASELKSIPECYEDFAVPVEEEAECKNK